MTFPAISLEEAQRRVHNVGNCDAERARLELAPNGDDYNNIMAMMNGGAWRPPHTEGR